MDKTILPVKRENNIIEYLRYHRDYCGRGFSDIEIFQLIDILTTHKNCSLEDIAKTAQVPLAMVVLIKNHLKKSEKGMMPYNLGDTKPDHFNKINWEKIKDKLFKLLSRRIPPKIYLDQCLATKETVFARIRLMWNNFDIAKKRILILGDDDHLSVGIGLLDMAEEIVVLDIDNDIVKNINKIAKNENIRVKAFSEDFHYPLKKIFRDCDWSIHFPR